MMRALVARVYRDQFSFQREYTRGRALNVGSNTDGAGLARDFGAVNLDLRRVDHVTGQVMPVGVLGDARALPFLGVFDTVILGEILEHMEPAAAIKSLVEGRKALRPGGAVVVTLPHDRRREDGRLEVPAGEKQFYAPGIYAYHYRPISRLEALGWFAAAGLDVELMAAINYVWGEEGSGFVAKVRQC